MYCCFGWAMWCFIIIHSSVCLSLQVQARSQLHRIIFWYNLQLLYLCQCHCVATSIKSPSHKCKNILSALPYTTSATLLRTGSVASSVVYGRSWRRCIIIIHFEVFIVIYSTTNNLLLFSQLYFGYWLAGLFWAMWCFFILHSSVCLCVQVQAKSYLCGSWLTISIFSIFSRSCIVPIWFKQLCHINSASLSGLVLHTSSITTNGIK